MKWIPISYCQWLIENNATDAGKLFCYAKHHSDGVTPYPELLKRSQRYFGVSDSTIRRWLRKAKKYNWIGHDRKTGKLFIRSWQHLFDSLEFPKKACFRFRKKDLKHFKVYCFSAVITYMAKRTQDKELERLKVSRSTKGRSNQVPAWVPMSASAIAKTLNIPEPTARKYRNLAVKHGYIKKIEDVRPFHLNVQELKQFRQFSDEPDNSVFIKDGIVFKQHPDKVKVHSMNVHSPKRYFVNKKFTPLDTFSMPYNLTTNI